MTSEICERVIVDDLIVEIAKVHSCQLLISLDLSGDESVYYPFFKRVESEAQKRGVRLDLNLKAIVAASMADVGNDDLDIPAIRPRVMKMIECKEVTAYHMRTSLPLCEISEVIKTPNAWYMSPEDAEKVKNVLLTARQREAIDLKKQKGRYTLEEAAEYLLEFSVTDTDDDEDSDDALPGYEETLKLLSDAAASKELPVYKPGTTELYEYKLEVDRGVSIYYEEALWSDLNQWLGQHLAHAHVKFPDPNPDPIYPKVRGVTKRDITSVDWHLPGGQDLKKILNEMPEWIQTALVSRGKPGGGFFGSHLWNPARIAVCLCETRNKRKQGRSSSKAIG